MSSYSFIATDYELPEKDNTKTKYITVQEAIDLGIKAHELMPWEEMDPNTKILYFENEDDLYELEITREDPDRYEVSWYTDKPFIYSVEFKYSDLNIKQLLEYIKENISEGQRLELWSIWIDDKQIIQPTICSYEELSLKHLKKMYNWEDENHVHHSCIIIDR
jgi:hypothetical protein